MRKTAPKPQLSNWTPEQIQRLWEWILHEDHLFTNRANFLLVAEAMLFAGFATLLTDASINRWLLVVVAAAGIIVTLVWLYIATVQNFLTMNPIKRILEEAAPEYGEIALGRRKPWPCNVVLGIVLPSFLLVVWLALLVLS